MRSSTLRSKTHALKLVQAGVERERSENEWHRVATVNFISASRNLTSNIYLGTHTLLAGEGGSSPTATGLMMKL